ncbi:MAG: DNA polymerase III subunit gamma/tau [Acidobacteriota bacterium]
MSYQVIARKWRPQTFDEVVGQSPATRTLKNAILHDRIAHAYLFAGSRGVGKTTTARILAKALNCVQGPTVNPCNQCDPCREITAGSAMDVLEIDAASNRGIDEIRELRENVRYAAARDRFKVFIIDEVHMLTTEAFNALLKTLEEPPPQVVFILATTELHKVPSTVLSRCQQFNFRAIAHQEILDRLLHITGQDQIRIEESALNAIVRAAEGSMRDAQSLLDQVISFCGREVSEDQVRDLLGLIPYQLLEDLTSAIAEADGRRVLRLVEELVESGRNLQHFLREFLTHLRNLLMVKIVGTDREVVPLPAAELNRLVEAANHFSEEDLTRFFSILSAAENELRWSSQPRFHLEIGLIKLVQAKRLVPLERVLAGLEENPKSGPNDIPARTSSQLPKSPPVSRFTSAAAAVRLQAQSQTEDLPKSFVQADSSKGMEQWKTAVSARSPMLSSILDHAAGIEWGQDTVNIRFHPRDRFHYEMLNSAENLQVIQQVAESVCGVPKSFRIQLNTEAESQLVEPTGSEAQPGRQGSDSLLERVKRDPAVKSFVDVFHAEIADIKEFGPDNSERN